MNIKFRINDDIVTIQLEQAEEELIFKLINDNTYTVKYINELIANKMLNINGPLTDITRIERNEEVVLYPLGAEGDNVDAGEEGTDQKKESWGDPETRFILDKYELYLPMIGPIKRFKKKKNMWEAISVDLEKILEIRRTSLQIENRYKTILKRKKKTVEHNSQTGEARRNIAFEEEVAKISAIDDSIEPELLASANKVKILKRSSDSPSSDISESTSDGSRNLEAGSISNAPKRKKKTLHETLTLIHKEKEESRERRHKEKLELIQTLFKKLPDE